MFEAGTSIPPGFDALTFAKLSGWVKRQLGIIFTREQKSQFADRLRSLLAAKQLSSQALLAALESGDRQLTRELAEVMSTNYTFFMREAETFSFMRQHILPTLPAGPLRIWSAACSSGDEAYTTAIHCCEHFGMDVSQRVKILGTDISQRQIESAEAGIFPSEQLALIDNERRARWFVAAERPRHLQVTQRLRDMCTFRRMNLTQFPWPFEQRFHLIFVRNVLYYLAPTMRQRVLEACYDVALPGAFLLTSLTEPMFDLKTRWRRAAPAAYQRGDS